MRLTGTDAWGRDAPFVYTAENYKEALDAPLIREGHNKIRRASAGWTRAVVILDGMMLRA